MYAFLLGRKLLYLEIIRFHLLLRNQLLPVRSSSGQLLVGQASVRGVCFYFSAPPSADHLPELNPLSLGGQQAIPISLKACQNFFLFLLIAMFKLVFALWSESWGKKGPAVWCWRRCHLGRVPSVLQIRVGEDGLGLSPSPSYCCVVDTLSLLFSFRFSFKTQQWASHCLSILKTRSPVFGSFVGCMCLFYGTCLIFFSLLDFDLNIEELVLTVSLEATSKLYSMLQTR